MTFSDLAGSFLTFIMVNYIVIVILDGFFSIFPRAR